MAMPEREDQLAQRQEVGAPDRPPPAVINQRQEVPHQMTPAQLVAGRVERHIGPMTIRCGDSREVAPNQLPQRRSGAAEMEQKGGRYVSHHRPQAAAATGFLPAGLVKVGAVLSRDGGQDGLIHRSEGGARDLLEIHHTTPQG